MITEIVQVCLIPLLGILTKFLVDYLSAKRDEIKAETSDKTAKKYVDMIYNTVVKCVIATNQTYVEALKEDGAFTKEAQEEAFNRTMNAVLAVLNKDAKDYITEATGDLQTYLTQLIEFEVNKQKIKKMGTLSLI